MIKNEPSRDLEDQLRASLVPLRLCLDFLLSRLPEGERSLAEHLRELGNGNLASSENIVAWWGGLEASIRNSNCGPGYCEILGFILARALTNFFEQVKFVGQGWPPKEVVDAYKGCLVATFDKILDTSPTSNAPETKETAQQQTESLQRAQDARWLLLNVASLVGETRVFDPNEVKLIMIRTAQLLNFSPKNRNLAKQRRINEEIFLHVVAGQIIPRIIGQKEISWEDQITNYPKKLKKYLRQVKRDRPLIQNFLAVLAAPGCWIDRLHKALQTQASGSQ
jgi:hypothetical protein